MSPTRTDTSREDEPDPRAASALEALRNPAGASEGSFTGRMDHFLAIARGFVGSERIATRWWIIGVGALMVVAAIGAVLFVRSTTADSGADLPFTSTTAIPMTTAASPSASMIVVHAAGAVRTPGVYRLPAGSRVVDLVDLAGGAADDIDLDRVNLASTLTDGERVFLPHLGASAPVAVGPDGGAGSGGTGAAGSTGPVDLNHATAAQLDALPGVGPTTAAAIVAYRQQKGPFRSVDDLLSVRGIGASKLDAIRDLVTVG
jgi:competence protein ComEA